MMAGNITAICFGAMAAIIVSLCTRGRMTAEEVEAEWEKTRDIDNPLNPWVEVYKGKNKSYHRTVTNQEKILINGTGGPRIVQILGFQGIVLLRGVATESPEGRLKTANIKFTLTAHIDFPQYKEIR